MIRKTNYNSDQKEQQQKNIKLTNNTNKKDLLMNIVNILKMTRIRMIGSLMAITQTQN
jgi:hypothetical protein